MENCFNYSSTFQKHAIHVLSMIHFEKNTVKIYMTEIQKKTLNIFLFCLPYLFLFFFTLTFGIHL